MFFTLFNTNNFEKNQVKMHSKSTFKVKKNDQNSRLASKTLKRENNQKNPS